MQTCSLGGQPASGTLAWSVDEVSAELESVPPSGGQTPLVRCAPSRGNSPRPSRLRYVTGAMFLIMMVVGLVGLAMMALPAFTRHGTAAPTQGHAGVLGHGTRGGHIPPHGAAHGHAPAPHAIEVAKASASKEMVPAADVAPSGIWRRLPSPRGIFTALALYGAFANAFVEAFRLTPVFAALAAVTPTLLVERFAVRPLWNLVFRFQGRPSAPLDQLVLADAVAVVPFRNGRGIVSAHREGRVIQLAARLCDEHALLSVKVGDRLRIEEVDAKLERVTVSVLPGKLGV